MFLGACLCGSSEDISGVPEPKPIINSMTFRNMYIDEVYVSNSVVDDLDVMKIPHWDYSTVLHADFEEGINGGNITNSINTISAIKIKKRIKGEQTWKTIYIQEGSGEVNENGNKTFTADDFNVSYIDYLEPSNTTVEYMYVPIFLNGTEEKDVNAEIAEVYSQFDSWFLVGQYEKDENNNYIYDVYPMIIDTSVTKQLNKQSSTVTTLYGQYPYVISNGNCRYYSGNAQATFIELCNGRSEDDVDAENGWKYRNSIDQFLTNDMAKIMKSFEGDIFLIMVTDAVTHSQNGVYLNTSTSFNWTEIGDPMSIGDLYDNGFIDTEIDRGLD